MHKATALYAVLSNPVPLQSAPRRQGQVFGSGLVASRLALHISGSGWCGLWSANYTSYFKYDATLTALLYSLFISSSTCCTFLEPVQ